MLIRAFMEWRGRPDTRENRRFSMQNDNQILDEISKLLDQQIEALHGKLDAEEAFLYWERRERILVLLDQLAGCASS
jgi:hypothetical protein